MKSEIVTVFTPTYNRAHTLPRTYESLIKQSNKSFKWLIIDDGSTDNTKELVESWMRQDNGFKIKYIYKENGGMHTAHNVAYRNIDTELNVCIDSDDCLATDAINKVILKWSEVKNKGYAGIIGLDADLNTGHIIGTGFDEELSETTVSGYYNRGGSGDKKLVYRTEIINKYPEYPVFDDEKYYSLSYKYLLIDQDYKLATLNEILCNVEYQSDGSSMNMIKQYYKNPKGFANWRLVRMKYDETLKRKFIDCVHYVSSSKLAGNKDYIKESPNKLLTIISIPMGYVLFRFVKCKAYQKQIV